MRLPSDILEGVPSPCFLLQEHSLLRNLEVLDAVRKRTGVTLLFALKAFASSSILPMLAEVADGATVSSLAELEIARHSFAAHLHAYAPVFRPEEWETFDSCCHRITLNSLNQVRRFASHGGHASYGLRINPRYSPVTSSIYNPCSEGSRLGVTPAELGNSLPETIEGMHCHNLCESGADALQKTLQALERNFGHFLSDICWLNLGGGHLVTRDGYDLDSMENAVADFRTRHPHLELIIEPGAAFVWETGVLVATVLDIVNADGMSTALLDTSFAAHMPDCLEMPYRPRIAGESLVPTSYVYRMGGCSCLAGDWVGDYCFSQPLRIGQRVVFEDMMHYTMVKTNTFNGINLPAMALEHANGTLEVLKRFGPEDVRSRLP